MAAEDDAVKITGIVQDILNEGGDPVIALARIVTTVDEGHSLLCLTIKANHDDHTIGATVTFDERYLLPPLFEMAQNVLTEFIESMSNQGEVDVSNVH